MTSVTNTRRCLTRTEAAAYCNITPRGLDDWVKRNIVPGPLAGTHRWDRKAIDRALDKRSGLSADEEQPEDAFDAWKRKQNEKRAEGSSLR